MKIKTILYVPTAHTENGRPSPWLQQRLDMAIDYAKNHPNEDCLFLLSGRGPSVENLPQITEAETCKRYVQEKMSNAKVVKEDISTETAGNFAFSKPIMDVLNPNKIVIYNSRVVSDRTKYLANKILGADHNFEFVFIDDDLSKNPKSIDKEPRALKMFHNLLDDIEDGDSESVRNILLYETPFYFKGIVNEVDFFNKKWPGGYENKQSTENSKWGK